MTAARVLIVEDERIIALHLRQQLTRLGYDVPNAVSTGDHALRRIEQSPPDVVLMDIHLKGKLDGIDTAAAIRQSSVVSIIYLTAYSGDETLARAAATNPHGYLLKPFSERELHAMIQMTLARCRAERVSLAAHERRLQTNKMDALARFAGGVADEVDDWLASLYGQLEVLGGQVIRQPVLTEPIDDAFSQAIEKERLVRRLLEFGGRRKLAPASVSMYGLMQRVSLRLQQILGENVALSVRLPDGLWQPRVDPDRLSQALANLAANARAAMPDNGCFTIEAQNIVVDQASFDGETGAGRYVLLSLSDTGTGMEADVVERAFEPFFTTRSSPGGNGLGLSLVFAFIRQSGGGIRIASKPGNGTTVSIYLPATASDDTVISAPVTDEPWRGVRFITSGEPDAEDHRKIVLNSVVASQGQVSGKRNRRLPVTAQPQIVSPPVSWHRAENAVFASVPDATCQGHYRLIVEPMAGEDGWDWTVWHPGSQGEWSRHGRASSVVSAMAAAENAAEHWWEAELPDDGSDLSDGEP